MRRFVLPMLCAVLASACSDSGPEPAPSGGIVTASPASATKPVVTVPAGPAPTALHRTDLVVGTGAEARAGSQITVQYVGVSFATRKEFDSSWERPEPFSLTLGQGMVIKGWDQGIVGMKIGGRRQLVIPPDLAYGAEGFAPVIGPNETLVFVVDLVAVA